MFKSTFKYSLNPAKGTVTVRPTTGTLVKWFAPTLIMTVAAVAFVFVPEWLEEKEAEAYDKHMESIPKD